MILLGNVLPAILDMNTRWRRDVASYALPFMAVRNNAVCWQLLRLRYRGNVQRYNVESKVMLTYRTVVLEA